MLKIHFGFFWLTPSFAKLLSLQFVGFLLLSFSLTGCGFINGKISSSSLGSTTDNTIGPSVNLSGAPTGVNLYTSFSISVSGLTLSQKLMNSVLKFGSEQLAGAVTNQSGADTYQASASGDAVKYVYKISRTDSCTDSSGYSSEKDISIPITDDLTSYDKGAIYVCVIGIDASGHRGTASSSKWSKGPLSLGFSSIMTEASENAGSTYVEVELDYPAHEDMVVPLISGGAAQSGVNYSSLPSSVTIPAGSKKARINFSVSNDSTTTSELNLNLNIGGIPGIENIQLNEKSQHKVWIQDVSINTTPSGAVQKVAAGMWHSCGITATGVLKCWGYNSSGQLGDGSQTQRTSPVIIDAGTNYSSVALGNAHTCGITTAGVLKCWGYNDWGQLGDGSLTLRTSPVIINAGTNYSSVALGTNYTCGITTAGVLKCWGNNSYSQLGDGSSSDRILPVIIDTGTNYSFVASEESHSCGITTAGVLKCWGVSWNGQLGDGTTGTQRSTPVIIDAGTNYSTVALGNVHSCGITTAGVLKCWGSDGSGQVGQASNLYSSPSNIVQGMR